MILNLSDNTNFNLKGFVSYSIFKQVGDGRELLESHDGQNTIVTLTKDCILHLLADCNSDKYITKVCFGTGSGTPAVSDTYATFTDPYVRGVNPEHAFDFVSTPKTIQFSWSLLANEYNDGYTVNEIGLLTDDETLIARKLIPSPFLKENDIVVEGTWTLQI